MKNTFLHSSFIIGLTLVLAVLFCSDLQAQRPAGAGARAASGSISGVIVDKDDNTEIPTAAIAIWSERDSSLVTGAVSLADGSFKVEGLRPGSYYAKVSFLGYQTASVSDIEISGRTPNVDLGTVFLLTDAQQLAEVEVEAEREFVEVAIDRTVYNTADSPMSAGGSASDVLETIPSVEVDIDGNLSLRGNANVAVLINGRPSPVQGDALSSYLQSLSAEMVEKIEVIPNPSAKYEPDGMAGILNIVMKKNTSAGLSGSVTSALGTSDNYNVSGNLNYQQGKLNIFSSYGFRHSSRDGGGDRFTENRFRDPVDLVEQLEDQERLRDSNNAQLTVDYSLSDMNTLTFSGNVSHRAGDESELNIYDTLDQTRTPLSGFNRIALGEETDLDGEIGLAFRRVTSPGQHELTIEAKLEREVEDENGVFTENDTFLNNASVDLLRERQNNEVDENGSEGKLNIDYMRPVGLSGRFEVGGVSRIIDLNNNLFSETYNEDAGAYLPDLNLNNEFDYRRLDNAAYAIYGHDLGKIKTQIGVRAEQSNTTFSLLTTEESFDNNTFSYFPSAFATYEISPAKTFKLSYSKRINRPRTRMLNPFSSQDDAFSRRVGNPYIKPEYTHSMEAGYTQFTETASFTLTPFYRKTIDAFSRVQTIDGNGVITLTYENFDTRESWGSEFITTYRIGRKFNAFANITAFQVVSDGTNVNEDLTNKAFGWSGRMNASYAVTPSLDIQYSQYYRAPMKIEYGRMEAFHRGNLAIKQKLMDDKASLSFRMNDIFGTMKFKLYRDSPEFYMSMDRVFDARVAYVSFQYNFGKSPKRRQNSGGRPDGGGGGGDMEMEG